MRQTKHFQSRMSQRGIRLDLVDLVCKYGVQRDDKTVLSRKGAEEVLSVLADLQKNLKKILDKGGLVVVAVDDQLITGYRLEQ